MVQLQLKRLGILIALVLTTCISYGQGPPRLRFTQLPQADSIGSILITDSDKNLQFTNNLRYLNSVFSVTGDVNFDSGTLHVDATNNRVGIGTSSPLSILDIDVNSVTTNRVRLRNSTGGEAAILIQNSETGTNINDGIYLGRTSAINYLWTYENEPWVFATNNTERMRITSTGNVGIGTTTPSAKLDVVSSSTQIGLRITSDGGNEQFKIQRYSNSNEQLILGFNSADYATIQAVEQTVAFRPIALNPSGGNVGIGTTSPQSKLQVSGEIASKSTSGGAFVTLDAFNGTNVFYIKNNGSLKYAFGTNVGAGTSDKLTIYNYSNGQTTLTLDDGSSNVGVGTTSPSYKLHVNGSVAGVGGYVNLSDIDYKKNIYDLTDGLDKILQLRPVTFNWKNEDYGDRINTGFIAQEVELILPDVVLNAQDGVKSLATTDLIPVLTKAIQEQQAIIETQNTKITELETALQALITRVEQLENQ